MTQSIWQIKSDLEIVGSFGYEFTQEIPVGKKICAGGTVQAFQVKDRKTGKTEWFDFMGAGTGTSIGNSVLGNIGIGGGPSALPSKGTSLYGGIFNVGGVELDELNNKPGLIISGSVSPLSGASAGLTVVIFNPIPHFPFPLPLSWHSIGCVAGLNLASGNGAGLMQYYGIFTKSGFGETFG
jgi:hypothetical protein